MRQARHLLRWFGAPELVLAAVAPLAGQGAVDDLSTAPRIAMVAFKRLHQMNEVVVIDVRDAASYRLGHIPGAIAIPVEALLGRVEELRGFRKPIVTYCAEPGERSSARAALDLKGFGLANVRALTGGWAQWRASGGAVEKGEGLGTERTPAASPAGRTSVLTSL